MDFLSKKAKSVVPYTAGEQLTDRQYVKLNTNECAYPPSPKVAEAIKNFDFDRLRRYPDITASPLRAVIADYEGIDQNNIFCSNGSDESLAFAFAALFNTDKTLYFADVTYSFYPVYARLFDLPTKTIALDSQYKIVPTDYFDLPNASGIIIANPNAPSSLALSLSEIESIVKANSHIPVVIDEAYIDFCDQKSAAALTKTYKNLLVIKTFSKSYALAGMRIGYALGDQNLIMGLTNIKDSINSYTVDMLAQTAAIAALSDQEYYKKIIAKIVLMRENAKRTLAQAGYWVADSQTNFLFLKHKSLGGEQLYWELRKRGVLARFFNTPRTQSFVRLSIGNEQETAAALKELQELA